MGVEDETEEGARGQGKADEQPTEAVSEVTLHEAGDDDDECGEDEAKGE